MLELDGERVLNSEVEVGYLHRGFEKTCENKTWFNLLPYTDRLNYVSPLINNLGYVMTVEKLLGLDGPRAGPAHPGPDERAVARLGPPDLPRRHGHGDAAPSPSSST